MGTIGAALVSILAFTASVVFTPQHAIRDFRANVLGDSTTDAVVTVGTSTVSDEVNETDVVEMEENEEHDSLDDGRVDLQARKAERIERAEAYRLEMQEKWEERKEEMETRRAEHRMKIEEIRDERKRGIVEKVCTRFENLNENMTAKMNNALERMTALMGKIESRTEKAMERDLDVSSCNDLIDTAYAAIDSARTAVSSQAGNTYACEIVDEATLGESLSGTRKELGTNLKDTRDSVHQARSAITQAVSCLKGIRNIDGE